MQGRGSIAGRHSTMASGNRALIGKILAASAALMFVVSGVAFAGLLPLEPDLRYSVGLVLAGIGVMDTLMAVYFIITDPA
jgi:hypothetical protein